MKSNRPRKHHYAPQFFLRNFATSEDKNRIATVTKHGAMAVWEECSIKGLGYEQDFYVHMKGGIPVSVEEDINRRIETPISQSDTWKKIAEGRTDELNTSDKPILYALIRHLEIRTPHYQEAVGKLARMASDYNSVISFTEEERAHYMSIRSDQDSMKTMLNRMSTTFGWTAHNYMGACLMIFRSPIPLRSSTTPVISIPAPFHEAMTLEPLGIAPFQRVLTLNPNTIACLILGDFDGAFSNQQIDKNVARGFNRYFAVHFADNEYVRHLIANDDDLIDDMTWAPYDLINNTDRKITFRRRA